MGVFLGARTWSKKFNESTEFESYRLNSKNVNKSKWRLYRDNDGDSDVTNMILSIVLNTENTL